MEFSVWSKNSLGSEPQKEVRRWQCGPVLMEGDSLLWNNWSCRGARGPSGPKITREVGLGAPREFHRPPAALLWPQFCLIKFLDFILW
jgi:hypothetical protein